jgi:Ca-activated chloride channel family protein
VGLLPFAGTAFLMCPLTIDYSAFENTLTAVNTTIIPRGGTNLAAAIDLAASSLTGDNNHKILILLTDGENLEGDAKGAAAKAAQNGMTIFTVGVGTPEGELIPQPGKGPGHFVKDDAGKFVTAKLDEATLTTIAGAANGLYAPLGKNGEGLEQIYQEKLRLIPKQELAEKQHRQPLERFSWPLGAACLLLAVEFMISGRKPAQALQSSLIKTAGRRIRQGINIKTVLLGLLISLIGHGQAHASKGEEAFAAGDYLGAGQFYDQALKKNPDDPRLHYNAGAAAYKNNLYDEAIASFQQALKSDDLGLQEQTYYNLGNALYQKGEELAQSNPEQAKKLWQQALDAYNGSLHLNPAANDSKENRDLVSRRLEELNKQQDQQQQSQNDQQQQDRNQDQKQDEKQGQKQEQSGEPQDQQGQQDDSGGQQENKDSSPKPDESSGAEKSPDDHQGEAKEPAEDQSGNEAPQAGQSQAGQGAESGKEDQPPQDSTPSQAARQTQAGKMSEEEARQLLGRLKEEEGKLNFIPQAGQGKAEKEGTWKDW